LLAAAPDDALAIVTSATAGLASARLAAAGLGLPRVAITREHITHGKPAPEGYLAAAAALGVEPAACAVLEDAPPGVAAGRAAGAFVVGVLTTHSPDQLDGADVLVEDLRRLRAVLGPDAPLWLPTV
jgi:mannitol-1-/sugar-/sorbitol-6-phosphatase